ncbi:MAG: GDP-mannose 4,6-dehydratase [Planctomycetes bacterium]|nr:GDP-mannose 4,6-dehydratase [Planctomycetota bacterium]
MEKTVLVTGVAGFLGSNFLEALLERGYRVVGIDNLSQSPLSNLEPFLAHPRFRFVQGDVRDRLVVFAAASTAQLILHLAAYKIPRYSDALDTLTINATGTENILEAARTYGCRVVAASTSDIYGKNPVIPFTEDMTLAIGDPTVKRWSYAISKMFEEQLCFAYRDRYRVPVVIPRYFGGYGPRENPTWWGGPQSVFIECALRGEPMPVHGDGLQSRTFTYVSDHVDGTIRCLETESGVNQVYNIGNTREITILELARMIWRMVRADEPRIELVPYERFGKYEDVLRRLPDITKARRMLGFEPKVALEEGLAKTIAWHRSRPQGRPA